MVAAAIDPLLTADEIVRLKREGVADLSDVLVFAVGQHHEGDHEFTEADLETIVRNFESLSAGDDPLVHVPVGIGHKNTANPSVGRVTKLWATPDGMLHAKFGDLPRRFAEQLDKDVWRYPSIVIDDEPPNGCPGQGFTLRAIDVVDQPAVKRLLKMPKPQYRGQFAEHPRGWRIIRQRVKKHTGGFRTFSEVTAMDRAQAVEKLKALGWADDAIAALDNLPDEDLFKLVLALAVPGEAPAEEMANAEAPPREQMIADLVAAGEDEAMLQGLSDADLLALWTQKIGGNQSEHSEGNNVSKKITSPVVPSDDKPITAAQFSELKSGLTQANRDLEKLRRDNALLTANQRREFAESGRRAQADRLASVKSYCERWSRDAYVLPAEVDPKSTVPNLYHRLMNADGVRTRMYGEKKFTEFDAIVAEIEARGAGYVRRFFSEKIANDPTRVSKFEQAREAAKARHAQRTASRNDTPASRLGLLAPASHR